MTNSKNFDVVIVGGSYAGLSAAMTLGRSLRKVLVIDNGLPCNRQAPYSHNFLTQDGKTPGEIVDEAKTQVLKYKTVKFLDGVAVTGKKIGTDFLITTQTGEEFMSRKLIFATGIKDIMPNIKGFSECWGITVIHCPYCHGYEFREQNTGIMATGERAFHIASLVNNLTKKVTVLTSGKGDFNSEQLGKLKKHNIKIIDTEISEIEHDAGKIKSVVFKNDNKINLDVAYAAIPFEQHSDLPASLGCKLTQQGHIEVDEFRKTTVDGIYACGDNSSLMRSVANAVATGNLAGAMVNMELTNDHFF